MTEKLILGGGGGKEDSRFIDNYLVNELKIANSKSIAYIPIALDSGRHNAAFAWFNSVFSNRIEKIKMWEDLATISLDDMREFGAIYIGGGNTVRLLQHIKSTRFDIHLKSYILGGGIVYGGSAGAIILGKDIRTAPEARGISLNDYEGLNVLGGYSILCHYDSERENKKEVLDLSSLIKSPIISIPEKSGIVSASGKLLVLGNESVDVFYKDSIKTFSSQQNIVLNF